MAENSRIEDLRRRVEKDPASIAFAQLAEEYRRAGQLQESVQVCQAGLAIHPGYLSARVTLGRAFLELNHLDEAEAELTQVLKSAPENLAAIRGLAEIHHRRGHLAEALVQYRAALNLARNDPDLQQTVDDLARKLEPKGPPRASDGLTFEQMTRELASRARETSKVLREEEPVKVLGEEEPSKVLSEEEPFKVLSVEEPFTVLGEEEPYKVLAEEEPHTVLAEEEPYTVLAEEEPYSVLDQSEPYTVLRAEEPFKALDAEEPFAIVPEVPDPSRRRAVMTIEALESWLDAIHAAGAERHP